MVPSDLDDHYESRRVNFSLRTKSIRTARQSASSVSLKLEGYWQYLRLNKTSLPGSNLVRTNSKNNTASPTHPFSGAVQLYLDLKGLNKAKTFHSAANRACSYLTHCCGDKDLNEFNRSDATAFRDYLVARGLNGSSVVRVFTTIKSIFNFSCSEYGLDIKNPFSGIYMNREDGVQKRLPIPNKTIITVQEECRKTNDDIRWLVGLISDTGLRLSEATGLAIDDIVLDDEIPHLIIQPHPWRRLKTKGSQRIIPLVGFSLWSAKQIKKNSTCQYAFPRYIRNNECLSNSASASVNKWLKTFIPKECSVHSFRHSMRDRLRAVECPKEIIDQIGGWSSGDVGESYGEGFPLDNLNKWLSYITINC